MLVSVALNSALLPVLGLAGTALASTVSYWLAAGLMLGLLARGADKPVLARSRRRARSDRHVQQALSGRPITVYGDGTQTRCFCHVNDVVNALIDLMSLGEQAHGEVFNVGAQEEISMLALADRVYEVGFEDMPRRYPDNAKIAAAIGWAPTRSLGEILEDVIEFHQAEAAVV